MNAESKNSDHEIARFLEREYGDSVHTPWRTVERQRRLIVLLAGIAMVLALLVGYLLLRGAR